MGRAAHRDARRACPGRRHPHARPVSAALRPASADRAVLYPARVCRAAATRDGDGLPPRRSRAAGALDRKSTRLNSSHLVISYAVFCLKKKKFTTNTSPITLTLILSH